MKMRHSKDREQHRVWDVIAITAIAVSILIISAPFLWTGRLNTTALGHSLNDQVGYVTAARNLATSGMLESSLYYPALIPYYKSHNVLYMPGNYCIRATVYSLLGYSIFTTMLPSLLSYIATGVVLYLILKRAYDRRTAYIATISFLLFPPFVLYAFSAMMETVFVLFCVLALYLFLQIPLHRQFLLGALTIAPAFLIRESAALMVPGFAALIYAQETSKRIYKTGVYCIGAVILLAALKKIPFIAEIPPHFSLRFQGFASLYTDAYALEGIDNSVVEKLKMLMSNIRENIAVFIELLRSWPRWDFWFFLFMCIFAVYVAGFVLLLIRKRTFSNSHIGWFHVLPAALAYCIMFSVSLYFMWYNGIRQMLFVLPFMFAVLVAGLFELWHSGMRMIASLLIVCASLYVLLYIGTMNKYQKEFARAAAYEDKCEAFLDEIGINKTNFFIAPFDISLAYVNKHFPIRWSFIPDNERTLALMTARYRVDLLLIPVGHPLVINASDGTTKRELLMGKFEVTKTLEFLGRWYFVYEAPDKHGAHNLKMGNSDLVWQRFAEDIDPDLAPLFL